MPPVSPTSLEAAPPRGDATLRPMPGESAPRLPRSLDAVFVAEARDLRGLPPAGRARDRDRGPLERGQVDAAQPAGGRGGRWRAPRRRRGARAGIVCSSLRSAERAPEPARCASSICPATATRRSRATERDSWQPLIEGYAERPPDAGAVRGAGRRPPRHRGRGAPALRVAGDDERAGAGGLHQGRQAVGDRARAPARRTQQAFKRVRTAGARADPGVGRDGRRGGRAVGRDPRRRARDHAAGECGARGPA